MRLESGQQGWVGWHVDGQFDDATACTTVLHHQTACFMPVAIGWGIYILSTQIQMS